MVETWRRSADFAIVVVTIKSYSYAQLECNGVTDWLCRQKVEVFESRKLNAIRITSHMKVSGSPGERHSTTPVLHLGSHLVLLSSLHFCEHCPPLERHSTARTVDFLKAVGICLREISCSDTHCLNVPKLLIVFCRQKIH